MNRDELHQLALSTETSVPILAAIAEGVGDHRESILAEWQEPTNEDAIIARATQLATPEELDDGPLIWGAAGEVGPPEGAIAYKYADPTEGQRWVFEEADLGEIESQDAGLVIRINEV